MFLFTRKAKFDFQILLLIEMNAYINELVVYLKLSRIISYLSANFSS